MISLYFFVYLYNNLYYMSVFNNNEYKNILTSIGLSDTDISKLKSMWSEPWRFYHTEEHPTSLLNKIEESLKLNKINKEQHRLLVIVAFFHDCVYKPWSFQNEEESIEVLKSMFRDVAGISKKDIQVILDIIICTKLRALPEDELAKEFWLMDNSIWINSDFEALLKWEKAIFKEFQFCDYTQYKAGRIKFLTDTIETLGTITGEDDPQVILIDNLLKYVRNYSPRIGVYAGSFDPFTIGHLNVLEKAEAIFDKVIVARGINSEKDDKQFAIPFMWRQVENYDGLISDYIQEKEKVSDVTYVRGLRNGKDLDYEMSQLVHIQKMKPDIKFVFITCDTNFNDISSSAVRNLLKIKKDKSTELAISYIYKGLNDK